MTSILARFLKSVSPWLCLAVILCWIESFRSSAEIVWEGRWFDAAADFSAGKLRAVILRDYWHDQPLGFTCQIYDFTILLDDVTAGGQLDWRRAGIAVQFLRDGKA